MSDKQTVRRYLHSQDIRYSAIPVPGDINDIYRLGHGEIQPRQIAKATILKDLRGLLMAITPGPSHIDIDALNRQLHRNLQIAENTDYKSIFTDCDREIIPCLGEAYGFETIIDDALVDLDLVYFPSGNPNELLRISGQDFQLLHSNAWFGNTFSHFSVAEDPATTNTTPLHDPLSNSRLKLKIENISRLPPMPGMAQQIIQLNTNPYAHANDLAQLLEQDPSLTAQVIRYAQSPFYGYSGQITSVRQAISRVLGYDLVMNIALGVVVTRPFSMPMHGPMGLHAFWRHAVYSAALTQGLCNLVPRRQRPRPGTAYLCGLLQNMGFLVLGHLMPETLSVLNKAAKDMPTTPIRQLEKERLSLDHCEIGEWIMTSWNMPAPLIRCIANHHQPAIDNTISSDATRESMYANLVYLSNVLLKGHNIGDADNDELPIPLLEKLGLEQEQVYSMLEKTLQGRRDLDHMAKQLAA